MNKIPVLEENMDRKELLKELAKKNVEYLKSIDFLEKEQGGSVSLKIDLHRGGVRDVKTIREE